MKPQLNCDTRLHLRFETFNLEAEAEVIGWIEQGLVDLFAFNDHTDDIAERLGDANKLSTYAARTGLTAEAFSALLRQVKGRASEVSASMQRIAAAARAHKVPMASQSEEHTSELQSLKHRVCRLLLQK